MKPVLDGTVALVTGASGGIGAASASALAAQGAAGGAGGAAPGQAGAGFSSHPDPKIKIHYVIAGCLRPATGQRE